MCASINVYIYIYISAALVFFFFFGVGGGAFCEYVDIQYSVRAITCIFHVASSS